MGRSLILFAALFGLLMAAAPAGAADMSVSRSVETRIERGAVLPFSRTARAQAVWADGACWTECQSYCTWDQAVCLEGASQGVCLKATDRCDRYCQRACRSRGGPYVAPLLGLLD